MELPNSIFKYTIETNGIHYIPKENIEKFKQDPNFKDIELFDKLKADEYNLSPILIINPLKIKPYYTPQHKKALDRYKEKNRDKINEISRNSYQKNKKDPEWMERKLERQREYSKKYRDKKKLEKEQQK
jgi:hypothetical protein